MIRTHSLRRGALALAFVSSLALAPVAPAAAEPSGPYRQELVQPSHGGFFGRLWALMVSLWGAEGATTDPTGHH